MVYDYKKEFNTPYSSIDCSGKLGLVEIMNLNQDMITEFFGSVGSDNKTLREKNNAAWIYTKTKVKIFDLPFWNTKTSAKTFVSSKSPIRIDLETQLKDKNQNLICAAKTEMCAIDFIERKIKKIDSLEFPVDLESSESGIKEPFARFSCEFDEKDFCYETKVFASDIDFTRHTNNAHYTKYLMNTFNSEFYDTKTITEFDIQFAKESGENSILRIYKKQSAENEYSFLIKNEEEIVVKAILKYSNSAKNWTEFKF